MFCYIPDKRTCDEALFGIRAADGTSCGNRMWCMRGECVQNQEAPQTAGITKYLGVHTVRFVLHTRIALTIVTNGTKMAVKKTYIAIMKNRSLCMCFMLIVSTSNWVILLLS